ncbi:MAG: hypothetical protein ACJ786_32625 [Catenulispora sp.]|jgi:hypothetical protein
MAEQTHQRAGNVQVVLTDPGQADDANPRVLVRLKDLETSLKTLSRLAIGDQRALTDVGVKTTGSYNTQLHEWAIGRDGGDRTTCYLIAGGPSKVDWSHSALRGLESVGHTHPFVPSDRTAFNPQAAPQVLQALTTPPTAVKTSAPKLNITLMQDDLGYLFPSNQDLYAAYRGDFDRSELVYSPYRLAPDGRLSLTEGGNISVKYGPVVATLVPVLEASLKAGTSDMGRLDASFVESKSLGFFWCAVQFFADHKSILTGTMQAPPTSSKTLNLAEFAMFYPNPMPLNAMRRSEMLAHITKLKG